MVRKPNGGPAAFLGQWHPIFRSEAYPGTLKLNLQPCWARCGSGVLDLSKFVHPEGPFTGNALNHHVQFLESLCRIMQACWASGFGCLHVCMMKFQSPLKTIHHDPLVTCSGLIIWTSLQGRWSKFCFVLWDSLFATAAPVCWNQARARAHKPVKFPARTSMFQPHLVI